jgi:uncharacterized metal-binding protein YceD (DUF177 family)
MIIAIKDLSEGINEFEQIVPSENYKLPESEFYPNSLTLKIFVDRLENLFRFKTDAVFSCDRCLETYKHGFNETIEHLYQLGHSELDSDEIEILPENSKEIDISQTIHDAFILNRPIQLLCKKDCKGLCVNCGVNLNKKSCNCQQDEIDPRFEKLKLLLK